MNSGAERCGKPVCHIGRHARDTIHQPLERDAADTQPRRYFGYGEVTKIFPEHFARMRRIVHARHINLCNLMVIKIVNENSDDS